MAAGCCPNLSAHDTRWSCVSCFVLNLTVLCCRVLLSHVALAVLGCLDGGCSHSLVSVVQVHPQPMPVPAVQLQPMATPQPVMVPTVPVQPLQPVIVRSHAEPVLYAQEEAYSAVRVPAQPPSVRFAVNDVYTLQHHKVAYVYPEARGYGSRSASPVLAVTDWAPRSSVRSASPPVSVQELRSMSPTLMQHRHCTTCTCQSCKSS